MTFRSVRVACLIVAVFAAMVGMSGTAVFAEEFGGDDSDSPAVKLIEIREQRVRAAADVQVPAMAHPHNRPGLHLLFMLPDLAGRRVLEINAVRSLDAHDSEGTDLTEIAFDDQRDPEQIDLMWGEDPDFFLISLGLPARAAGHFDLRAKLDMLTYEGTETLTIEVSDEWTEFESPGHDGGELRVRYDARHAMPAIVFKPGTVRHAIESVELVTDEGRWTSNFSSWSDAELRYFLQGVPEISKGRVKLTVRSNMRTVPVEIDIQREALR